MKHGRALAWTRGKIRVLIIAGPDSVGDWMGAVISSQADMAFMGLVRDLSQPMDYLEALAPDVILVDISSGILHMGDLINALNAPTSGAAVIVVAVLAEVEAVRQAMLHGAQGFLLKPFSEAELLSSIRQANELMSQRRAQADELPRLQAGPEPSVPTRAKILAVYSPKGGVGCTTVAVNLAVAVRARTHKEVTLVDADLRFGDVDTALNILAGPSIGALASKLDDLDDLFLEQSLVRHASGVRVLTAPPFLDMADEISPDALKQILSRLAARTDGYLIVDTWSTLDELTLAILDACDKLIVVTTGQLTALRDTHRFLEALALLHYDREKLLLVLNHPYQPSSVKSSDVERALGHPIAQEITHVPHHMAASVNRGVPLVQGFPDSPAARDITSLARCLNGTSPTPREPGNEPEPNSPAGKGKKRFSWRTAGAGRE